jgi:hydroxymethylpyrimidine pyrophosphatase-like HAD family hydrolase
MLIQKELNSLLCQFKQDFNPSLLNDKFIYANWLAQTYYYVAHSTSLLGYSLPHLNKMNFKRHFEKHLGEEAQHDLLVLKDLERLGFTLQDFPEQSLTQAFYQSQYYRIAFEGGSSLLGYILFLEAMTSDWGKLAYDQIKKTHKNSALFLKVHAEEDPDHVEKAIQAIMELPHDDQGKVISNMYYSYEIYSKLIQSISSSQHYVKAA